MDVYSFYSIGALLLAGITVLFITRNRWLQKLTVPDYLYIKLPPSFQTNINEGLSSDNFDLEENVAAGDARAGLDSSATREIKQLMRKRGMVFDEARRIYTERIFQQNGINADGRPQDPKFVSFS